MRFLIWLSCIIILTVSSPFKVQADSIILSDFDDTYIEGSTILGGNNNNYGNSIFLNSAINSHLWGESLLKANGIFGDGDMQISSNAEIFSAELHLWLDISWGSPTNTLSLYQLTTDWNEDTVTSNNFGRVANHSISPPIDTLGGITVNPYYTDTEYIFNVTASLLDWQSGISNFGWGLTGSGPRNQFFSSEYSDLTKTPYLVINYETTAASPVPEPATMILLGTGLLGLAGAQRKFKK